jgi:hypothetical protein
LIARQAVQKCNGTGNRYDPFDIIELSLGNPLSLNLRINAGQCLASDGIDRASTVNGGQKAVTSRPWRSAQNSTPARQRRWN